MGKTVTAATDKPPTAGSRVPTRRRHGDVITEGGKVVCRNTVTGTRPGEYRGPAPTGRSVGYGEILVLRLAAGRVAEIRGRLRPLPAAAARRRRRVSRPGRGAAPSTGGIDGAALVPDWLSGDGDVSGRSAPPAGTSRRRRPRRTLSPRCP
ncbi:ester cyclase [Streptomyces sp. NPDC015414]|uniref:ester cyclase n=1 Tax=Streptomyces sp. NPDC015414 TaxID=3364957 RepID=UPI0037034274